VPNLVVERSLLWTQHARKVGVDCEYAPHRKFDSSSNSVQRRKINVARTLSTVFQG
jgi:hypothetical protein